MSEGAQVSDRGLLVIGNLFMAIFDRIQRTEFYRRRASLYDLHQMSGRNAQEQTDFVNRGILKHLTLTSQSQMLDIGCGDGSLLALAAAEIGAGVGIVPTQEECIRLESEQHS